MYICVCVYMCIVICVYVLLTGYVYVCVCVCVSVCTGIYCVCTNTPLSAYVTRDTEVYLSGHTCVGVGDNRLSIVCRAHAFVCGCVGEDEPDPIQHSRVAEVH